MSPDILSMIEEKAKEYHFEPALIKAIVMQESSGNPKAMRFEPNYKYLYFPEKFAFDLNISVDVETHNQKTSFGLMQCIGALAREQGYLDHLENLAMPLVGLDQGCQRLRTLFSRQGYSIEDVISAYNQGGRCKTSGGFYLNQKYVDQTIGYYRGFLSNSLPPAPIV